MTAAPITDQMFPPFPDDLFFEVIKKLEAALKFQGKSPLAFWDCVRAYKSRKWCQRDLLRFFVEPPVVTDDTGDEILIALVNDDDGLYAADDPRRVELALDAIYNILRQYANFVHIG